MLLLTNHSGIVIDGEGSLFAKTNLKILCLKTGKSEVDEETPLRTYENKDELKNDDK